MFYAPKHATPKQASAVRRRAAGIAVAGVATAGAPFVMAESASAATVWDAVAACESGGNWSINTGNGFYGGLQFTTQTWQGFGGGKYASNAHLATKSQQIEIAQKVLAVQGPGAWPVCSVRAGLTKANGGATTNTTTAPRTTTTTSRDTTRVQTGALVVDGVLGPKTKAATERWVGGSANGALDSADIRALQGKLGVAQDGIVGPITTTALQALVGAAQDGIWGHETTSKLQSYLNAR
ncbi:transglycosylase family protein [Janibacter sp. G56]|uniref:transglycosylase family protein n=1 Tax=Janibacter sp. G56 TaxID=3418717 RepID=UPI003CFC1E60